MIMITNLFSIFDPSTPNFLSSNWSSLSLLAFCLPLSLWINPSRLNIIESGLTGYIFSEFSPLINNAPFVLLSALAFFFLIIFNNLIGLLPYVFTASSHLVFTISLALPAWLGLIIYGWTYNTANLLAHLIPQGTPVILIPFIVIIETISNLIRPGTLAVRLTANMIAGHLLLVLLSSAFLIAPAASVPVLLLCQIALSALELAVALIQAYVFSVLITLYVAEATN